MPDYDALIIGAGLFGQVIGKHLKRQGRNVTIFDADYAESGSKPAACLIKPSWLGRIKKADQAAAMAVLDENFGVHEMEAYVAMPGPVQSLGKRTHVFWVAPGSILKTENVLRKEVVSVDHEDGETWCTVVEEDSGRMERFTANLIVVATGVWCNDFLPDAYRVQNLRAQWGAAFTWPCDENRESRVTILPYAPYKQLVSLPNRYPGELWVGDGTALFDLSPARLEKSLERCQDFVGERGEPTVTIGRRPYIRGLADPAYVVEVQPGLWAATGGAKNGTVGAGWAAHKIAAATN